MSDQADRKQLPSLPQNDDAEQSTHRAYELSLARTAYNYTTSYLSPAPLAAQVPEHEKFTLAYKAKVAPILIDVAVNLKDVLIDKFEEHLKSDLPTGPQPWMAELVEALEKAEKQFEGLSVINAVRDLEAVRGVMRALRDASKEVGKSISRLSEIPQHLVGLEKAITKSLEDMKDIGVTAFLKDPMYEMLHTQTTGDAYLHAKKIEDFATLYPGFPFPPRVMTLEPQEWMRLGPGQQVWECDWYFGWLQIAGFNTTNLRGVFPSGQAPALALDLDQLLEKIPVDDAMLRSASGDSEITLQKAAELGRLYAVDMAMLKDIPGGSLHGDPRHVVAPIAVFYWNAEPPPGFPPGRASMQPVAIQCGQEHNAESCPVFVPGGDAGKWKLAKHFLLNALAVHHETIAHLGACHLTVETLIVASNRQLSYRHPVLVMLKPHFRFTLDINEGAKHSLIIPGGVVASVLSPSIDGSWKMVRDARKAWRFDQNLPHNLFGLRGVDADRLPEYPFRDDTTLLWNAIRGYVRAQLSIYYADDTAVRTDDELQDWVDEITRPDRGAFEGLEGLTRVKREGRECWGVTSLDYLVDMVSLIIYTGGPQHAGVNYAQYPLMSYLPSVAGTAYAPPPGSAPSADPEADYLAVLPPLDVSLYQISFGYLLSSVQYDTFGTYTENPRRPYFEDERAEEAAIEFRLALAAAEAEIRKRNQSRPLAYMNQIPSMIPNSISI